MQDMACLYVNCSFTKEKQLTHCENHDSKRAHFYTNYEYICYVVYSQLKSFRAYLFMQTL